MIGEEAISPSTNAMGARGMAKALFIKMKEQLVISPMSRHRPMVDEPHPNVSGIERTLHTKLMSTDIIP